MKRKRSLYDRFIRTGLAAGFTDDQVDFLWDFIIEPIMKLIAITKRIEAWIDFWETVPTPWKKGKKK